jgi:hypothetical protein
MEPDGSLLCSQEPATDPYSELDASSLHLSRPTFLRSILILSFYPCVRFSSGSFSSRFPTKIL